MRSYLNLDSDQAFNRVIRLAMASSVSRAWKNYWQQHPRPHAILVDEDNAVGLASAFNPPAKARRLQRPAQGRGWYQVCLR